jgi:hypothetical protein
MKHETRSPRNGSRHEPLAMTSVNILFNFGAPATFAVPAAPETLLLGDLSTRVAALVGADPTRLILSIVGKNAATHYISTRTPVPEDQRVTPPLSLDASTFAGDCCLLVDVRSASASRADTDNRFPTFLELVQRAHPRLSVNDGIVQRAMLRYPQQILLACSERDASLALAAYDAACELPGTATTTDLLSSHRVVIGGPLYPGSSIEVCFRDDDVPKVLKPLSTREHARVAAFLECAPSFGGFPAHVAPFEVLHSGSKHFMLMPRFVDTLAHCPHLTEPGVVRLWEQMRVVLDSIHAMGFAHMDVKPSNICITEAADFVLIDLGSISRENDRTHGTPSYLPLELQPSRATKLSTAARSADWWMLAIVLCEKAGPRGLLVGGGKVWTQAEIRTHVYALLPPAVAAQLQLRLA